MKLPRKYITLHVKSAHIRAGKRANPSNDPISLALKEAGYSNFSVGSKEIFFGKYFRSRLKPEAREFIQKFDSRQRVLSFKFRLGVPTHKDRPILKWNFRTNL